MAQVFERNRKEADPEYIRLATEIQIEVVSLVMKEDIVPKRKRLILGAPVAETARSLVANVTRANAFYPSNSYNVLERKRYLTLASADCDQLERDFLLLTELDRRKQSERKQSAGNGQEGQPERGGGGLARKFERVAAMLDEERKKLSSKRKNTRIIGVESVEDRLAAARAEAERLEAVALDA